MGIRSWFSDVFGFDLFSRDWSTDQGRFSGMGSSSDDGMSDFNPANGLPMMGAVDIEDNPFGIDFHSFDDITSMFDDSFGMSSSDDSFSSMGSGIFCD